LENKWKIHVKYYAGKSDWNSPSAKKLAFKCMCILKSLTM
jgi:hypothetical protein